MTQNEYQQLRAATIFYSEKLKRYKAKFPNRWPSKSTVRRWDREFRKEFNNAS